jgi:hypothetical protein
MIINIFLQTYTKFRDFCNSSDKKPQDKYIKRLKKHALGENERAVGGGGCVAFII